MSEHHWHVKEVLKCLCKAGLYAKTEEIQISLQVGRVSRIHPFSFWSYHDKVKIIQDWLESKESQGHSIFFRFCKLLPPVHLQLFGYCHSIDTSHPEGHFLEI